MKSNFVSLHPYFKLFYGFTSNGEEMFCRKAYENAEALLAHVENIGALLAEMLKSAGLTRIEVHGLADELEKLKKALAHLNRKWFAVEESRK